MAVLDLLLPTSCAGCGRYGMALCGDCRASYCPAGAPGDRFLAPDPGVVVGDAFELAMAAFRYEGVLRRALQRLKYGGAARLAEPLVGSAAPVFATLAASAAPGVLVPVPVHAARLRERGYNQAALLARALARVSGLRVRDVLTRVRATAQQHRLDRAARLRNLRAAFRLQDAGRPPPTVVILVDDILTTSATLEACAGVLRSAGSERIFGFAIAREV